MAATETPDETAPTAESQQLKWAGRMADEAEEYIKCVEAFLVLNDDYDSPAQAWHEALDAVEEAKVQLEVAIWEFKTVPVRYAKSPSSEVH